MRVLFLVLLAFTLLGCRLVGTADVELTYEASAAPVTTKYGEDIRALVMRRLSAAQIGADVEQNEKTIKIVVDETVAPVVDDLVRWGGTLQYHDAEYKYIPMPTELFGLTPKEAKHADGVVERYWEGPRSGVLRAVEQWSIDKQFLLLAEAEWSDREEDPIWRTRIVRAQAFGELGDGIMVGRGEEGTLRLRAQPTSPAEDVLHDAKERPESPFLVRGRISLGPPQLQKDAAVLSFGGGIRAYARAQQERLLLVTPRLPALRRTGIVGLPPNNVLAAACFVVPLVLSLAWLVFVRRFDRAHPEPVWLVLLTFILGAVATIPASFLEVAFAKITPWLDPRVVTFGGQAFAFPLALVVFTLVVGLVEEGTKPPRSGVRGAAARVRRAHRRHRVRHRVLARLRGRRELPLLRGDAALAHHRRRALLHERTGAHVLRRDLGLRARRASRGPSAADPRVPRPRRSFTRALRRSPRH